MQPLPLPLPFSGQESSFYSSSLVPEALTTNSSDSGCCNNAPPAMEHFPTVPPGVAAPCCLSSSGCSSLQPQLTHKQDSSASEAFHLAVLGSRSWDAVMMTQLGHLSPMASSTTSAGHMQVLDQLLGPHADSKDREARAEAGSRGQHGGEGRSCGFGMVHEDGGGRGGQQPAAEGGPCKNLSEWLAEQKGALVQQLPDETHAHDNEELDLEAVGALQLLRSGPTSAEQPPAATAEAVMEHDDRQAAGFAHPASKPCSTGLGCCGAGLIATTELCGHLEEREGSERAGQRGPGSAEEPKQGHAADPIPAQPEGSQGQQQRLRRRRPPASPPPPDSSDCNSHFTTSLPGQRPFPSPVLPHPYMHEAQHPWAHACPPPCLRHSPCTPHHPHPLPYFPHPFASPLYRPELCRMPPHPAHHYPHAAFYPPLHMLYHPSAQPPPPGWLASPALPPPGLAKHRQPRMASGHHEATAGIPPPKKHKRKAPSIAEPCLEDDMAAAAPPLLPSCHPEDAQQPPETDSAVAGTAPQGQPGSLSKRRSRLSLPSAHFGAAATAPPHLMYGYSHPHHGQLRPCYVPPNLQAAAWSAAAADARNWHHQSRELAFGPPYLHYARPGSVGGVAWGPGQKSKKSVKRAPASTP